MMGSAFVAVVFAVSCRCGGLGAIGSEVVMTTIPAGFRLALRCSHVWMVLDPGKQDVV